MNQVANMKRIVAIFAAILIMISIVGCNDAENEKDGYIFVDDLGRTVCVQDTNRVASLLGSFTDMWMLSGGKICATADDAWEDFNLPLGEDVINLGSSHRPDKESLIASQPTLVLASAKLSKHVEMQETLDGLGITVAYFDVGNFQDYLRVLKIMTDVTGQSDMFVKYGQSQEEAINDILKKHEKDEKQSVLVMKASAASIKAKNSEDTTLGGMLKDFGCINIADSDTMVLDNLSVESILMANPDKIFFIEMGDDTNEIRDVVENTFYENPLWKELDAVKNNKVYFMDKNLYNLKPNARFVEAYENLEKILYEE